MRKKMCIICLFFLIGFCLFFTLHLNSQGSEKAQLKEQLIKYEGRITKWENSAKALIVLIIIVGSLGIITGILQRYKKKWCKLATIISGVLISLITVVNNTVFDIDHRTLLLRVDKGRQLLSEIHLKMIEWYDESSKEERDIWWQEIFELKHKIDELSIEDTKVKNSSSKVLHGTLYAKDIIKQEPLWLKKIPDDKQYLFFVGIGENQSLKKAKDISFKDAIEGASDFFHHQLNKMEERKSVSIDVELFSKFLVNSAKVTDTFYHKNSEKEIYEYYTLIKINKKMVSTDIMFFAIKEKVSLPKSVMKTFEQIQQSSKSYFSRRSSTYYTFLQEAKKNLTNKDYKAFIKGRLLRKEGNTNEAIKILEQVLETNTEFYFGWYNLALAYQAGGQFEEAKSSYEKAIQLEPKQILRDASVYNSFGYLLFQCQKYKEAIKFFNKALEIDSDHQIAKWNLKNAKKALKNL